MSILELSHNTATYQESNAEWRNELGHGTWIEEGDAVQIKNIFLNTQKNGDNSQQIVFDENVTLSMTIGYYDWNWNIPNAKEFFEPGTGTSAVTADYKPYVAYQLQSGATLQEAYQITVLGESILSVTVNEFQFDATYYDLSNTLVTHTYKVNTGDWNFDKNGTKTFNIPNPIIFRTTSGGHNPPTTSNFKVTKSSDHCEVSFDSFNTRNYDNVTKLYTNRVQVHLKAGVYSSSEFCKEVTEQLTTRKFLNGESTYAAYNWIMPLSHEYIGFYPIGEKIRATSKYYYYTSEYFMGASQCTLVFDQDTQTYKFEYLHTPIINDKVLSIYNAKDAANKYYTVPQQCGIFFTELTASHDANFWYTTLGFKQSEVIMPFAPAGTDATSDYLQYIPNDQAFMTHITKGFASLQSMLDPTNGDRDATPQTNKYVSTNSLTISLDSDAIQGNRNPDGGYFLIDIDAFHNSAYQYGKDRLFNIAAIVSKAYSAGDYVTAYGDAGITYVHQGQPLMLKDFNIRILRADTKQPTQALGANSAVFLQVIKAERKPAKALTN